ncbi:MAG: hypothetical protein H0W47_05045 [Polaromonas sp.]|uniref:hypothetical protein n=1 Tax=Polaromonas sp. TaxID=1869339 RepID=UPI00178D359C|nr:hypothetical protein [Polaromonas sp.]MBA3593149.1 hypothetical protein [Polaromonas sp.]
MTTKKPSIKRKSGRPALEEGVETIPVTVRMTAPQKEKLTLLGGSKWVRERISKAKEPRTTRGNELLKEMAQAKTTGDLRRVLFDGMDALRLKEISTTDLDSLNKSVNAVTRRMNAELKRMKTALLLQKAMKPRD